MSKTNLRPKKSAALTMNCSFATVMLNDYITFKWRLSNQFLKTSKSRDSALPLRTAVQCIYCKKSSGLDFFSYLLLVYNSFLLQFVDVFISCAISHRWENQIISLLTNIYIPENCPFSLTSYPNSHTGETH